MQLISYKRLAWRQWAIWLHIWVWHETLACSTCGTTNHARRDGKARELCNCVDLPVHFIFANVQVTKAPYASMCLNWSSSTHLLGWWTRSVFLIHQPSSCWMTCATSCVPQQLLPQGCKIGCNCGSNDKQSPLVLARCHLSKQYIEWLNQYPSLAAKSNINPLGPQSPPPKDPVAWIGLDNHENVRSWRRYLCCFHFKGEILDIVVYHLFSWYVLFRCHFLTNILYHWWGLTKESYRGVMCQTGFSQFVQCCSLT